MQFVTKKIDDETFDQFVKEQPTGTIMQLSAWPKVKAPRWYSRRVALFEGEALVATAVLLFKKLPVVGASICYCPRGFVMDYAREDVLDRMLEEVEKVAREEKAFVLKIDPNVRKDNPYHLYEKLTSRGFKHHGFTKGSPDAQPRYTMATDIDKTEKELLQSFQSRTKSVVRKSTNQGLICEEASREELPAFAKLSKITGERDGFLARGMDYFGPLYDAFFPTGDIELYLTKLIPDRVIEAKERECREIDKDQRRFEKKRDREEDPAKLQNIEKELEIVSERKRQAREIIEAMETLKADGIEEEVLSGALLTFCGEEATYLYGASSNRFRELLPNYLMQWTMMKRAMEKGAKIYDFGGVSGYTTPEEIKEDPMAGLYEFKKRFGSHEVERIGEFDYVLQPLIHRLFETAFAVRHWIYRLKKRRDA